MMMVHGGVKDDVDDIRDDGDCYIVVGDYESDGDNIMMLMVGGDDDNADNGGCCR